MLKAKDCIGFFIVFASFFLFELLTLSHYGVDFDTINHLPRGQAYLHYFLTGKLNYKDLPEYVEYHQDETTLAFSPDKPRNSLPKRSIYQIDDYSGAYFLNKDGGHPPLTDIFASAFNLILFQKLQVVNDIDSYHVYIILLSAILVAVLFLWIKKTYGTFSGIIGILSLILYPLFLGESHFNLKDVPETAFYTFTVLALYEGLTRKKLLWIILSAISFGFAWGTKFNILFSPFTVVSWLVIYYVAKPKPLKQYLWLLPAAIIFFLVSVLIFWGSWPYLWKNTITHFLEIVNYYKTIGINPDFDRSFIHFFFNTYALQWILYTTPLIILVLSIFGIIYTLLKGFGEKEKTALFVLLWFLVPIARVTMPNAGIYGGVRQIMEYIPAMAVLSGIGAGYLRTLILPHIPSFIPKPYRMTILTLLFFLFFLPITLKLVSIHPNENVYFNPLIGGLKGAKQRNFPYWGNSFGNAYRQGVKWVNQHAEGESTLVLAQELMPNLPRVFVRSDLKYGNNLRSGYLRQGEYVIGLDYGLATNRSYYSSRYYNQYLLPIYQVKIDDTTILNIWKNDLNHTKKGFVKEEKTNDVVSKVTDRGIFIDMKKPLYISKIFWSFSELNCKLANQVYFNISVQGNTWYKTPHVLPEDLPIPIIERQPVGNTITYPFAAEYARYIYIIIEPENSCPKNIQSLDVFYLPEAH